MDIVIPIGIHCYFDFDCFKEKLRSFRFVKRKASINAIQYVRNLARKIHCETLFTGHTPSSVGIGGKGSEKFASVQIFQLKVYG